MVAIYLQTARAQVLGNISTTTKKQDCASAFRAHSSADSLSLLTSVRAASPENMFTNDHNQGKNRF